MEESVVALQILQVHHGLAKLRGSGGGHVTTAPSAPQPMILPGGSRFTWLWALLIGLSVVRGTSLHWLPPGSPLHEHLCRLMPGLPACGR
jgi:hypothetical protein